MVSSTRPMSGYTTCGKPWPSSLVRKSVARSAPCHSLCRLCQCQSWHVYGSNAPPDRPCSGFSLVTCSWHGVPSALQARGIQNRKSYLGSRISQPTEFMLAFLDHLSSSATRSFQQHSCICRIQRVRSSQRPDGRGGHAASNMRARQKCRSGCLSA